ncbi:phosphotransferase family protein [Pseudoduganella namucuonensis]|uniref:Phosphotransferase enzyme family protein n=1 Tax=Pseudoduganella namucuonensis TaxID=1035707 RepID=A0A1I7IHF3_9BURK|nr:aminoglycoside phosphotransferase family protein [Pseudoduganella namucuonensis]SFU72316.1 Phosphotransferase enzyme family protein [Pseudoduganella namucuonensis]
MTNPTCPEPLLDTFLIEQGLARPGEPAHWSALTGGVSSDIWRVDLPGRSLCVKRALSRLKVAADWEAPLSRNAYEWAWIQFAARHSPDNVPAPLAHDAEGGVFAMSFLAPEWHPVWKRQLMDGEVEAGTAAAVGRLLGRLHAASAGSPELAAAFDTGDNFQALRIEPYLLATAARHPAVAQRLRLLALRTAGIRAALVHGDVSPKNILVGPRGPVLLDAECAWYGDPAFDLAFCLNHLLLKCLAQPARRDALAASFTALAEAYFHEAHWEPRAGLEARAAELLPALLLARVDGKSPVEYLTNELQRTRVRAAAIPLLHRPAERLALVAEAWLAETGRRHS